MEAEMESPASFVTPAHQMGRARLLHALILSLIILSCKIYGKLASQPGLLGTIVRSLPLAFVAPVLQALQYHVLAIASFIDDGILALEIKLQHLFPPSSYLFDMMEWVVGIVVALPALLDKATQVSGPLVEKEIVMDSHCPRGAMDTSMNVEEEKVCVVDENECDEFADKMKRLDDCMSLLYHKQEKVDMVDEKLCNLYQCEEEYESTEKMKMLGSVIEEEDNAKKLEDGKGFESETEEEKDVLNCQKDKIKETTEGFVEDGECKDMNAERVLRLLWKDGVCSNVNLQT